MILNVNDGKLEITGIEGATRLVNLPKEIAGNLADYSLHLSDLKISLMSLENINSVGFFNLKELQESLWRSAIIHFIKCFSNQHSRGKLDPEVVFQKEPPEAMEAFKFIKNLRNKHIAHDENAYLQCLMGIALNDGNKNYKIERIICTTFRANSLDDGPYGNLMMLVKKTIDFIDVEFEKCCQNLTDTLEKETYDKLLSFGEVFYTPPDHNRVHKPREN